MKSFILLPLLLFAGCTQPIKDAARAEKEKIQTYEYMDTFGQITGIGAYVYTPQTGANKKAEIACEKSAEERVITTKEDDQSPQYYTHCQKQ